MPLRSHFQNNIRHRLKNPKFMNFAMGAMNALDRKPKLWLSMENGDEVSIFFEDVFCQTHFRDQSFEERVFVAVAWQRVLRGEYVYRVLQVREPPAADRDADANQSILDGALHRYADEPDVAMLEAKYYGGGHGADGRIAFARPFISAGLDASLPPPADTADLAYSQPHQHSRATRTSFPLEVGYCRPDQIFFHIATERCVARFPYDCCYIVFVENVAVDAGW